MNYPYYSPYYGQQMPVQARPGEMGHGYPQQQNSPQTQPVGQTHGISPASRPVSSREEAMAVGADFSGAPMIFPDMAHNAIYVKRWDYQSGAAVFTEFVPQSTPPTPSGAEDLQARLERIEADLEKLKKKGVKKNDDE